MKNSSEERESGIMCIYIPKRGRVCPTGGTAPCSTGVVPDTAGGLLHPIRQRIITVPHAINNIKNVRNLPHAPQSFHFLSAHLVSFLFVVHSNSLLSSATLSCLHRPTRSFCVSFYFHLSEPHRCYHCFVVYLSKSQNQVFNLTVLQV